MSWTPEREAEVRARLERLAPVADRGWGWGNRISVAADLAACLAELDRVREERDELREALDRSTVTAREAYAEALRAVAEERDGMRARVLGYADWLSIEGLGSRTIGETEAAVARADRLRELVAP